MKYDNLRKFCLKCYGICMEVENLLITLNVSKFSSSFEKAKSVLKELLIQNKAAFDDKEEKRIIAVLKISLHLIKEYSFRCYENLTGFYCK